MTFKSFIGTSLVVATSVGATWAYGTYQNKNLFASNGTATSFFKMQSTYLAHLLQMRQG